jgi:hypothetical protein
LAKSWSFRLDRGRFVRFSRGDAVVEWRIKLEARNGWREVETIEVARFNRRVVGLTAEEIGLSPEEAKRRSRVTGASIPCLLAPIKAEHELP